MHVQQLIGYTVTAYILFQGTCHLYHSEHMNDQSEPLPYCIVWVSYEESGATQNEDTVMV